MSPLCQGWIKERVTREMTQSMNLFRALRQYWDYLKPEASKLRFPCTNKFLWKLFAFWAHSLKKFASPIPCWHSLKNVGLKGHQITGLFRVHTCLGPALPSAHPNLAHTCCIFNKFGYRAVAGSSALMVQLDRLQANRFEWDGKRSANSWQIQIWKQTAIAYASVGQHAALEESICALSCLYSLTHIL